MKFLLLAASLAILLIQTARAQEALNPGERLGTATILHRENVLTNRTATTTGPMRLWSLYSSPESRMNYVEVTGRSAMHFHPDADHKLYVLEGDVVVFSGTNQITATPGDLIIIPRGVRHCYDAAVKGKPALLLTFDAPPFDPRKTVALRR